MIGVIRGRDGCASAGDADERNPGPHVVARGADSRSAARAKCGIPRAHGDIEEGRSRQPAASKSGLNYRDILGDAGVSRDNFYYVVNVTDGVTGTFGANLNAEIIHEQ